MYFATFIYGGQEDIGAFEKIEYGIVRISDICGKLGIQAPADMNELIAMSSDKLIEEIRAALRGGGFAVLSRDDVKLCAPVPYPIRNLICLGKNYYEHAKELEGTSIDRGNERPEHPIYFSKIADPAIGDGDDIIYDRSVTDEIDYEVELAVIIGKDGMDIKPEDVEKHIFGYTIANDVSARDLQSSHKQWFRGKSLNTFCPMGPYIAHKSIIKYPVELDLKCSVNGELRQSSNTRDMIFDIEYVISDISRGMQLRAGDIILTGTPSGVGLGFKPCKYLKPGDIVKCDIEKIGTIVNKVVEKK
ncbi:MAG: hydrolase [Peptoclostridium sp.]|uniref:fumarylacetoacetate hydrolase family protein n=1 Tax=Peptoclostridium sp. TaxID=1904860 RepID=UPI00139B0DCD|nr:fumarylacetoacetate hydrolase family protein [Peptoclostridium sp.]MZQ74961.1 hydrolase [Peptoclostridium sp.]